MLWFMAIGFITQYFLNMEIERYTLATGETAVTGFTRFWMPWGIFFILGAHPAGPHDLLRFDLAGIPARAADLEGRAQG